jgi:transcriptional regulator with XRE-family HTH domain
MTGEVISMGQVPANIRLRELRECNHFSQEQLADRLGIETRNLKMLEDGNRPMSASMVDDVCTFFECTKEYLFGQSDVYLPIQHTVRSAAGL